MRDWRKYTIETLTHLKLKPSKAKGQNFLIRYRIADQITKAAEVVPSDHILEIGGGLGILTEALINSGANITVIEKDHNLATFLQEQFNKYDHLQVIHDDALTSDWPPHARLVANLPYRISSQIVARIMHEPRIDATVMLQREVALRCLAKPGSKDYSRLSVLCAIHSTAKRMLDISPDAFYPKPKVNSIVLRFYGKESQFQNTHTEIETLTTNLFSLKRRIVRSVIRGFLKRRDMNKNVWDGCPHHDKRVFELSVDQIDEILTHLRVNQAWPLAV